MATKVQCKSYLPAYCRDLNEDLNNVWPFHHENATSNAQFYSDLRLRKADGYLGYDKELIRETVLKHDAIFRDQVRELHRLYRVQLELMDELAGKYKLNCSSKLQASHASHFSSLLPSEDMGNMIHTKCTLMGKESFQGLALSSNNDSKSPLTLSHRGLQMCSAQAESTGFSNGEFPECKQNKSSKVMIDLQLPADAYVDIKETEKTDENDVMGTSIGAKNPHLVNCYLEVGNDGHLMNDANLVPNRMKSWRRKLQIQNNPNEGNSIDLNKPVEELTNKKATVPSLSHFSDARFLHKDHQRSHVPPKSNSSLLEPPREFIHNGLCGEEHGQADMNYFHKTLNMKRMPTSSESEQFKLKKQEEQSVVSLYSNNKTESWLLEKQLHKNEHGRSIHTTTSHPRMISQTCSSFSAFLNSDYSNMTPPPISSIKELKNKRIEIPSAVHELPCSNGSYLPRTQKNSSTSTETSGNAYSNWKCSSYANPYNLFRSNSSSTSNGYLYNLQLEPENPSKSYMPTFNMGNSDLINTSRGCENETCNNDAHSMLLKSEKCLNLNVAPPNGFNSGFHPLQDKMLNFFQSKSEASAAMPWFTPVSVHTEAAESEKSASRIGLCLTEKSPNMTFGGISQDSEVDKILRTDPDLDSLQNPAQKSSVCGIFGRKMIFGVPIPDKACVSAASVVTSHQRSSGEEAKNRVDVTSLSIDPWHKNKSTATESMTLGNVIDETEKSYKNSYLRCRQHINLNMLATTSDQSHTSDVETQLPSPAAVSSIAGKFTFKIDLEAPPPQDGECIFSGEKIETDKINRESIAEGIKVFEGLDETTMKEAAEIMVCLSSDPCKKCLEVVTYCSSDLLSPNNLLLFANVVCSDMDKNESTLCKFHGDAYGDGSSDIDGMDFFEAMTLRLKETESDGHYVKPSVRDNNHEEKHSLASLLLTKPRKGQGRRRRRQKKDFQKDILPTLSSLSRHEVTEDLQTIGEMMKTLGLVWEKGVTTRQKAGRKGGNRQARGRGRSKGATTVVPVEDTLVDPLPVHPLNSKLDINAKNIMAWGRTRRCRRQRCPPGNLPAPVI